MTKKKESFCLEKIVSIEDVGDVDTYDFTIPKNHCFFANGVLVHNSGAIEEMADCVWLLTWKYQTSKSIEDEVDKNEFIVHVAKNRDGMTGYIKMHYTPEYCLIRDYPKETIPEPKQPVGQFMSHTPKEWEE